MREFSQIQVCNTFNSYSVNAGEYENEVPINEVLQALGKAMDVPLSTINVGFIAALNKEEVCPGLTPSEYRAVSNLVAFHRLVMQLDEAGWWHAHNPNVPCYVFTYVNLNTGASLAWVHSVI